MRLKVIGCKVLSRELGLISAFSESQLDITTLKQGLHNDPERLRKSLQNEIDLIDEGNDIHSCDTYYEEDFDAILLAYGLCCNGIAGLSSKRFPLIIPKAHDCITLLLGSKERYQHYFNTHKGVYWFSSGWIEHTPMPGKRRYENTRNLYLAHYGQENADYLMEMEQNWLTQYQWCTFIDWPEFDHSAYKKGTQASAAFLNWHYDEIQGDKSLLEDFLNGRWDDRFLVVPPGKRVVPSYDSSIIKSE